MNYIYIRKKLNESKSIDGIGMPYQECLELAADHVRNVMDEYDVDAEILEVWFHGSRLRGTSTQDSDLDCVVFYSSKTEREDDFFNILHIDRFLINGIEVDFNPVRVWTGKDIEMYKYASGEYDKEMTKQSNIAARKPM